MRIAVLSPVWFPVPPSGYGGIEWIVSLLADGLADAGHDVTLFASGDSRTRATLESVFPAAPSERSWLRAGPRIERRYRRDLTTHRRGAHGCGRADRRGWLGLSGWQAQHHRADADRIDPNRCLRRACARREATR